MTEPAPDPLETILNHIAEAAPRPWYPSAYAQDAGIARDSLDPHLEKLRLGGLIHLTDWIQGEGQGYALTPHGQHVHEKLRSSRSLGNGMDFPHQEEGPPAISSTARSRAQRIRAALLGPATAGVTYAILAANFAVFLVGLFLANQAGVQEEYLHPVHVQRKLESIFDQIGVLSGAAILRGEWWRLFTCCFAHFGLIHLAVNMFSLYSVGPLVERMWGHGRYLTVYLIAGLGGSCAMVIANPEAPGAGASGALWGIVTALAAWVVLNKRYLPGSLASAWLRQLLFVFVLNVAITFGIPNVSAAAHFGGGAVGLVAAVLLHVHWVGAGLARWAALVGVLALPVASLAVLARAEAVDPRWQEIRRHEEHLRVNRDDRVAGARRIDLKLPQLDEEAWDIFKKQYDEVIVFRVQVRKEEARAKALQALSGERTKIAEKAGILASQTSKQAEASRQYFQQLGQLFERAERSLRERLEWTEKDIAFMEEVKKLGVAWRRLFLQ